MFFLFFSENQTGLVIGVILVSSPPGVGYFYRTTGVVAFEGILALPLLGYLLFFVPFLGSRTHRPRTDALLCVDEAPPPQGQATAVVD